MTIVEPGSFATDFLAESSLHTTARQIEDYAPTAGQVRRASLQSSGRRKNDPAKGAAAIFAAITAADPPSRFQVGPDAVAMVERKLEFVRAELESWRALASSTTTSAADDPPPA